jgi:hypothetical protein
MRKFKHTRTNLIIPYNMLSLFFACLESYQYLGFDEENKGLESPIRQNYNDV